MKTIMTLKDLTTIDQIEQFLIGSQICLYDVLSSKDERYKWIQNTLKQFKYPSLPKREKGVLIRYLIRLSRYSRQQITRIIQRYKKTSTCTRKQRTENGFSRRYTDGDIRFLADLDELYETPCGAVIKKYCERAFQRNADINYARLATISVSHIYNLRKSKTYKNKRQFFTKTQSKVSTIGERRKPNAQGQPGYLRVDTVHQGDQDKVKGLYHVNLVDEVTQFEITFAVEKISEAYLLEKLEVAINGFPFKIRGFHSDNGSEYINKPVAELLKKLDIDFTKSRSRKSTDNALAESKNNSVIRKIFGHSHIPQYLAGAANVQLGELLYRHINFHRPCFFSEIKTDEKGKEIKFYPYKNLMTPFEKLASLDGVEAYLKEGITLADLKQFAGEKTDAESARELKNARNNLFSQIVKNTA
jgi:hypothetical protein